MAVKLTLHSQSATKIAVQSCVAFAFPGDCCARWRPKKHFTTYLTLLYLISLLLCCLCVVSQFVGCRFYFHSVFFKKNICLVLFCVCVCGVFFALFYFFYCFCVQHYWNLHIFYLDFFQFEILLVNYCIFCSFLSHIAIGQMHVWEVNQLWNCPPSGLKPHKNSAITAPIAGFSANLQSENICNIFLSKKKEQIFSHSWNFFQKKFSGRKAKFF